MNTRQGMHREDMRVIKKLFDQQQAMINALSDQVVRTAHLLGEARELLSLPPEEADIEWEEDFLKRYNNAST